MSGLSRKPNLPNLAFTTEKTGQDYDRIVADQKLERESHTNVYYRLKHCTTEKSTEDKLKAIYKQHEKEINDLVKAKAKRKEKDEKEYQDDLEKIKQFKEMLQTLSDAGLLEKVTEAEGKGELDEKDEFEN